MNYNYVGNLTSMISKAMCYANLLKTEDLATKPEDWRFEFLTVEIQILSVINW